MVLLHLFNPKARATIQGHPILKQTKYPLLFQIDVGPQSIPEPVIPYGCWDRDLAALKVVPTRLPYQFMSFYEVLS